MTLTNIVLQELVETCRKVEVSPSQLCREELGSSKLPARLRAGHGMTLGNLERLADALARRRREKGLPRRDLFNVLAVRRRATVKAAGFGAGALALNGGDG